MRDHEPVGVSAAADPEPEGFDCFDGEASNFDRLVERPMSACPMRTQQLGNGRIYLSRPPLERRGAVNLTGAIARDV
jgi:hypothetical protein